MKKKHTMFSMEMKKAYFGMIIFLILFIAMIATIGSEVKIQCSGALSGDNGSIYLMTLTNNISYFMMISIILVIILVIVQFSGQNDYRVGEFLAFLPYSKKELVINKMIAGVISFSVPMIFFAIWNLFLRSNYITNIRERNCVGIYYEEVMANESIKNVILVLLNYWLFLLFIYFFLILIQEVVNHYIAAGIVSVILLGIPYYTACAMDKASLLFLNTRNYYGEKYLKGEIFSFLCGIRGFKTYELNDFYGWDYVEKDVTVYNSVFNTTKMISCSDYFYTVMIAIPIVVVVMIGIILLLVQKRDFTVMGTLFINKKLQWGFIFLIFLCGMLMPLFWSEGSIIKTVILMAMMGVCISLCTRMIFTMIENKS